MVGTSLLLASFAHADERVDSGTFDSGYVSGSCGTGTTSRTCTYDINYTNCQEASASTGGPRVVVPCDVHFHGSVTVQPRLNAAGRVVGCTSVVGTAGGTVTFNSNVWDGFDRTFSLTDLTVQSAHPDQSAAAIHFTGSSADGTFVWAGTASMTASCAPGSASAGGTTAGSVTVAGVTQQ
jgi:hypothetical protein